MCAPHVLSPYAQHTCLALRMTFFIICNVHAAIQVLKQCGARDEPERYIMLFEGFYESLLLGDAKEC